MNKPITSFLILLAFASIVHAVDNRPSVAGQAAPPDILLIMPDQMRGDCLSILDHPAVRTPNLDKLAREGVLFRRGYATVPSCIPARYALLTGMSPQASGIVGYKSKKFDTLTLPQVLGKAGYFTVLVGRNMHQQPANSSVGYQREIPGSTYVEGDAYDQYLNRVAPQSGGIRNVVNQAGVTMNWWQANPWPLKEEWHPTAWTVRQSEKVIADAPSARPLFLTTSFYSPHPPLFPPGRYFDAMLNRALPEPAHGGWVNWSSLSPKGNKAGNRIHLQGGTLRRAQAGYYGLIEQLDTEIASLVTAFKARSAKAGRPWVIVFTSDHGEMMGDHGYFRKCEPYEGSANIPFIITASPQLKFKTGIRKTHLAALEDLMPTLLALAGAPRPAKVDGINLLSVLQDENAATRDILHLEHSSIYSKEQAFQCLIDDHYKYIWRPATGEEQLFNLDIDPREEHDLAKVAAEDNWFLQWQQRLIRRLTHRPERFTDGKRLIPSDPPVMKKTTQGKRS